MKKIFTIVSLIMIFSLSTKSQIKYSGKIECGYIKYLTNVVMVDPGPNWKGYNLDNEQNGIDINLINGISTLNNRLFTGIGLGYLNFEGINGLSAFTNFECLPLKTKITPLINLKIGYSHLWNQYEGGKGTLLFELGTGVNYSITEKQDIYWKFGIMLTQQSALIPISIGFRF